MHQKPLPSFIVSIQMLRADAVISSLSAGRLDLLRLKPPRPQFLPSLFDHMDATTTSFVQPHHCILRYVVVGLLAYSFVLVIVAGVVVSTLTTSPLYPTIAWSLLILTWVGACAIAIHSTLRDTPRSPPVHIHDSPSRLSQLSFYTPENRLPSPLPHTNPVHVPPGQFYDPSFDPTAPMRRRIEKLWRPQPRGAGSEIELIQRPTTSHI
jgi:hypothetical protein